MKVETVIAILSLVTLGLLIYTAIRLHFYRKFKAKKEHIFDDIAAMQKINRSDSDKGFKPVIRGLMSKRIVNLPKRYNQKEMVFIENWYMEEGINQLKASNKMECVVLVKKPPEPGCKYVSVSNIPVNFKFRDSKTLELKDMQERKTVTLLLLNEWIK